MPESQQRGKGTCSTSARRLRQVAAALLLRNKARLLARGRPRTRASRQLRRQFAMQTRPETHQRPALEAGAACEWQPRGNPTPSRTFTRSHKSGGAQWPGGPEFIIGGGRLNYGRSTGAHGPRAEFTARRPHEKVRGRAARPRDRKT